MQEALILIALGLFLLTVGGEFIVRSAVDIANRMGVSPLLIGLTLVGFGTSTPELTTSINAALIGSPGIAVGNIVGSNIANILLILGLSAILAPLMVSPSAIWRDGVVMVLVSAGFAYVSMKYPNAFSREFGAAAIGLLVIYVLFAWAMERRKLNGDEERMSEFRPVGWFGSVLTALGALVLLIVGADYLVDGAVMLSRAANLSDTFVGLTIVAVGTSLPELFTSVVAAIRRQGDISVGNILGSNIYNLLGVGGMTAIIQPLTIPAQIVEIDNWVMVATAVLLTAILLLFRGMGRVSGLLMLGLYGAYVWSLLPGNPVVPFVERFL